MVAPDDLGIPMVTSSKATLSPRLSGSPAGRRWFSGRWPEPDGFDRIGSGGLSRLGHEVARLWAGVM